MIESDRDKWMDMLIEEWSSQSHNMRRSQHRGSALRADVDNYDEEDNNRENTSGVVFHAFDVPVQVMVEERIRVSAATTTTTTTTIITRQLHC